jgi:hypothetical protein
LYFGEDPSVVRFSTQEYLLRSIQPIFVPLGVMALIGPVVLWSHSTLTRWIKTAQHSRMLASLPVILRVSGIVFAGLGIAGLGFPAVELTLSSHL